MHESVGKGGCIEIYITGSWFPRLEQVKENSQPMTNRDPHNHTTRGGQKGRRGEGTEARERTQEKTLAREDETAEPTMCPRNPSSALMAKQGVGSRIPPVPHPLLG